MVRLRWVTGRGVLGKMNSMCKAPKVGRSTAHIEDAEGRSVAQEQEQGRWLRIVRERQRACLRESAFVLRILDIH